MAEIMATHIFGPENGAKIIFVETGEIRAVAYGEVYLSKQQGVPKLCSHPFIAHRKILRPVSITEA